MASGVVEPDYGLDERRNGYVRIRVEIPNLKKKAQGLMSKISGSRKDQAKNAKIDCDFQERSFSLKVTGDPVKDMDGKIWALHGANLPHSIDTSSSHWETEDGFVNVYLKKANSGDDWSAFVRKGELDARTP